MPKFPGSIKIQTSESRYHDFNGDVAIANEHKAIQPIAGFPDFNCSKNWFALRESLYEKKGFNQYAPMQGIMPLPRNHSRKNGRNFISTKYNPEKEINITSGGTQAIFSAFRL